jgi:hypothetical protein
MEARVRTRGGGAGGGSEGAGGSTGAGASGGHPPEAGEDDTSSELLAPLLEEWRDVLVMHVLSRLDPTDCAILAQVGKPWLAVVLANNLPRAGKGIFIQPLQHLHLPRAGKGGAVKLKLVDFVGSVKRLAWAKDNGCQWSTQTCAYIAMGGILEVL